MTPRAALALAALLLGIACARDAFADDAEEARAAMRRGMAALEQGAPEQALQDFEAAKRLVPAANAPWFFSGQALLALGRWREAVTSLETYLAKDPSVSDGEAVRAKIASVRAEHFPARLDVRVDAPGAELEIDGAPVGAPRAHEVSPGAHRLVARAPGRIAVTQSLDVVGDADVVVTFALPPSTAAPLVRAAPSSAPSPAASPWRTVGWAALGAGAVGLGTTLLVDGLVLGDAISDYRAAQRARSSDAASLRSDAEGLQTGVVIGYVASSAIALAGGLLVLLAGRPTSEPRARDARVLQ